MHNPDLAAAAVAVTVIVIVSLVLFGLLWGASHVAAASGLGRLPKLPKAWQRWLFDENDYQRGPQA